jgi:alpha-tubulin suppressor-like RCC1 family protein
VTPAVSLADGMLFMWGSCARGVIGRNESTCSSVQVPSFVPVTSIVDVYSDDHYSPYYWVPQETTVHHIVTDVACTTTHTLIVAGSALVAVSSMTRDVL